jgi:TPP-dependent pyruvate/acetoin dehydrogenase alpha subunit
LQIASDIVEIYSKMYLLRRAESVIAEHYFENKIFSFVHFYIGQEAVAVGVCANLDIEDRVFGNHRSHGHYLAKGGDLSAMFAEMLGKKTGCCKGKGGSMHMLDRSVGFMGSTPILASAAPIAVGSSLQQKMSSSKNLTVVFVGDGAAEEGVFYESLNLASLMNLPILFVIENNLYSVNSPKSARKSEDHSYEKICHGMGMKYFHSNGNDVSNVISTTRDALISIKNGNGPAVIEATVYRHMAHSAPIKDDKAGYRVVDTEEERNNQDSLLRARQQLLESHDEGFAKKIEESIEKVISEALDFAINSEDPSEHELTEGLFL